MGAPNPRLLKTMKDEHDGTKSRDALEWFQVKNVPDVFRQSSPPATTSIIEWYFVYNSDVRRREIEPAGPPRAATHRWWNGV